MLKRGTGRRLWLGLAVAAFAAMAYTGFALAASDTIVAGPAESYSTSTYNADQGSIVQFQDLGGSHNVTARQKGPDGNALFLSPTIDSGTASVDGTQYLAAGDYPFFCTVHPTTMSGTLHVTGIGTPQARPQVNNLKLKTKTISAAIKKGLRLTTTPNRALAGVALTAKLGKATIAQAMVSLNEGWNSVTLKLSKAGKNKLGAKSKAKVTVTAAVPFGSPATAKGNLK